MRPPPLSTDYISPLYQDYSYRWTLCLSRVLTWLSSCTYISLATIQGYKQKKVYIIAEGPMEFTTRNMWKLIYDRKCGVVVMVSDLLEDGMVNYGLLW